jgi:hypothetical protein
MLFDVWNLVLIIVAVYATFAIFQSEKKTGKLTAGVIASAILVYLVYRFNGSANAERSISAPIFQQFNPFYVVALTPVSMAIFGALANKGKEPSAPRKIAYGMLVAAIGFGIMAYGSKDLNSPDEQSTAIAINKAESFPQRILAVQNDTTLSVENKAKALDEIKKEEKEFIESLTGQAESFSDRILKIENNATLSAEKKAEEIAEIKEEEQEFEESLKGKNKRLYDHVYALSLIAYAPKTVAADTANTVEVAPVVDNNNNATPADSANVAEVVPVEAPMTAEQAAAEIATIRAAHKDETRTSSYWLIFTYLILTFAELLLSPMGISFVSKVAPPKLKGMMMGGWFVATAIGNFLVSVGGFLWAGLPLWSVWTVFIALCLLSALFMFVMMKTLEAATK